MNGGAAIELDPDDGSASSSEDLRAGARPRESKATANRRFLQSSIDNWQDYLGVSIEYGTFRRQLLKQALAVTTISSYLNFMRWIAARVFIVGPNVYYFTAPKESSDRYTQLPPLRELRDVPIKHLQDWGKVKCFNDPRHPSLQLVINAFVACGVRHAYDTVIFAPNALDIPVSSVNVFVGPRTSFMEFDRAELHGFLSGLDDRPHGVQAPDLIFFLGTVWMDLCSCDDRLFYFFLLYFAHIVQRPNQRTNRVLCFKGPQGIGKTSHLVNCIGRGVFGNHYFVTENLDNILGNFNNPVCRRTLVMLEETPQRQFDWDKFKSYITSESVSVNEKFKNVRLELNSCNFCILTNNPFSGNFTGEERRLVIFHGSERFLRLSAEDKAWAVARLGSFMEDPERFASLCQQLYALFELLDLSDWPVWGSMRYDTTEFNGLILNNLNNEQSSALHFALVCRHAPALPGSPHQLWVPGVSLPTTFPPMWKTQEVTRYDHISQATEVLHVVVYPEWSLRAAYSDVRRSTPPERQGKLKDAKFRAVLMDLGVIFTPDHYCIFPEYSEYCRRVEKLMGINLEYVEMPVRPDHHTGAIHFSSDTFRLFRYARLRSLPRRRRPDDDSDIQHDKPEQHEDKKPKVAVMSSSSDKPPQIIDLTGDDN